MWGTLMPLGNFNGWIAQFKIGSGIPPSCNREKTSYDWLIEIHYASTWVLDVLVGLKTLLHALAIMLHWLEKYFITSNASNMMSTCYS